MSTVDNTSAPISYSRLGKILFKLIVAGCLKTLAPIIGNAPNGVQQGRPGEAVHVDKLVDNINSRHYSHTLQSITSMPSMPGP